MIIHFLLTVLIAPKWKTVQKILEQFVSNVYKHILMENWIIGPVQFSLFFSFFSKYLLYYLKKHIGSSCSFFEYFILVRFSNEIKWRKKEGVVILFVFSFFFYNFVLKYKIQEKSAVFSTRFYILKMCMCLCIL